MREKGQSVRQVRYYHKIICTARNNTHCSQYCGIIAANITAARLYAE